MCLTFCSQFFSHSALSLPLLSLLVGHCLHYDSARLWVTVAFTLSLQHPQVNEPQDRLFFLFLAHFSALPLSVCLSCNFHPTLLYTSLVFFPPPSFSPLPFFTLVSRCILAFVARVQLELLWILGDKGSRGMITLNKHWRRHTHARTHTSTLIYLHCVRPVGAAASVLWLAFMCSCRLVMCQSEYHITSDHLTLMPFHYESRKHTDTPLTLLPPPILLPSLPLSLPGDALKCVSMMYISLSTCQSWHSDIDDCDG